MNGILRPRLVRKSTRSRPARSADPRVGRYQHYRTLQIMVIVGRIALPLEAWTEGCRLACYPPAHLRGTLMPRQTTRRLTEGRAYRAPEALRGRSITLVDGGVLDVALDGRCVLAGAGARPGRGPRVEALSEHRTAGRSRVSARDPRWRRSVTEPEDWVMSRGKSRRHAGQSKPGFEADVARPQEGPT